MNFSGRLKVCQISEMINLMNHFERTACPGSNTTLVHKVHQNTMRGFIRKLEAKKDNSLGKVGNKMLTVSVTGAEFVSINYFHEINPIRDNYYSQFLQIFILPIIKQISHAN